MRGGIIGSVLMAAVAVVGLICCPREDLQKWASITYRYYGDLKHCLHRAKIVFNEFVIIIQCRHGEKHGKGGFG